MARASGGFRQRGDLDGIAEILQAGDETIGLCSFGSAVEVSGAEIAIELTADQHMVDGRQDRGGERPDRLFGAAAGARAVILRLEIAGLLAGGGSSALGEGGREPRGAFAHPSGSPLAVGLPPTGLTRGAFVVLWAQAGPGDQVSGGREAAHVAADFGEDDFGR